ncbi:MAG: CBO0543 family protein [Syntrophomonadaceae bacterium]|nr:CBO0543 family protein [Syntrophomonadaceae bacterium]
MLNYDPGWEAVLQTRIQLRDLNNAHWLHHNLFSFSWWLDAVTIILFAAVWWKLVDNRRLPEIVMYGLMVSLAATVLDIIGVSAVRWGYPVMVVPLVPPMFPADLVFLPGTYMLLYQYFPRWKGFAIALTITAGVLAFVFEPTAQWLKLYEMNNWKHLYSFPIYVALGIALKRLLEGIWRYEGAGGAKK